MNLGKQAFRALVISRGDPALRIFLEPFAFAGATPFDLLHLASAWRAWRGVRELADDKIAALRRLSELGRNPPRPSWSLRRAIAWERKFNTASQALDLQIRTKVRP